MKSIFNRGERHSVAQSIANELSVSEYHSELLPSDKVEHLEQILKNKGEKDMVAYVKSKNASGPFSEDYTLCSLNWWGVEGSTMYNITGTNAWMMIMDEYSEGTFFAQMTRDFENFRQVRRASYSVNRLNPRHGSVVAVSMDEYYTLVNAYGIEE